MIKLHLEMHELTDGIHDCDDLIDMLPEEVSIDIAYKFYPGQDAIYYPNDKAQPAEPPEVDFYDDCCDLANQALHGLDLGKYHHQYWCNVRDYIEAWQNGIGIESILEYEAEKWYE